ncbi:MAG: hypothetical protein IPM82_00075 [Saprospiraceae bacterium]|nr:hypothetical protein [Saprospiraceae bacterium]
MKKILFITLLFSCPFFTFVNAQSELSHTTTPIDSRLLEIYSGDYLEHLQTANPFLLKRWNFYLDNSWYLTELPSEKDMDSYATIRIEDLSNINIMSIERKFDLKRNWDKQLVCKIENTNQALVLLAGKAFNEKLNEFLAAEKQ